MRKPRITVSEKNLVYKGILSQKGASVKTDF